MDQNRLMHRALVEDLLRFTSLDLGRVLQVQCVDDYRTWDIAATDQQKIVMVISGCIFGPWSS